MAAPLASGLSKPVALSLARLPLTCNPTPMKPDTTRQRAEPSPEPPSRKLLAAQLAEIRLRLVLHGQECNI